MCDDEDSIMPTLMFSYYHLAPELKSCFSFCSLFPEDFEIDKDDLIHMWMAQGFLVPNDETRSMEDVGEKYVSILLHRCFFQDICRDTSGEIKSFKMHDLMHEFARKVAAKESSTLTSCKKDLEGKHRHLTIDSTEGLTTWFRSSRSVRTCLKYYCRFKTSDVDAIISNCCRLRVLDLGYSLKIGKLPDRLGKLSHLRYLDLSRNYELKMLPKSITKLHNLQTLKLAACGKLKKLPEDTNKLVNLRVLDISDCRSLTHMPGGMGTLTCLHTLPMFIVSRDDEHINEKLTDLIALLINNNLRGYLRVRHNENSTDGMPFHEDIFVKLNTLKLWCGASCNHKEGQETLLESLFVAFQCQDLRLQCSYYAGTKMPRWPSGLVSIELNSCEELKFLPSSLSQLCHLKYLHLKGMQKVKYIESDAAPQSAIFFPSLERLKLLRMPALKGWMEEEAAFIPSFPRLCYLEIEDCRELRNIPPCPQVKELYLNRVNGALVNSMKTGIAQSYPISLERLGTDNSCIYNSLGREFVAKAIILRNIENMGTNREGFQSCASLLRDLDIRYCRGLENSGIEHLTNLKSLTLDANFEGIPWKSLQCLTSLQSLVLDRCSELTSLPEEMRCLTSLTALTLALPNSELKNRCREQDGEDWPKICHIPNILFRSFLSRS